MCIREAIRHHDKATIRLACLCGNGRFELGQVANRGCNRLHCEGGSGGFEGIKPKFGICCRCRVEHYRDPGNTRCNLLSRSSHLPPSASSLAVKPVTLPPGRGKLADKPLPTGSATVAKTIGMVRVCCSSAVVVGVVCERIRSGCSATSSFANCRIKFASAGVAQRVSIRTLRLSVHPSFWSPSRNAA